MVEFVHSGQNFMNAEDAIIAKKRKRVERMEVNPVRHSEQDPHLRRDEWKIRRIETTSVAKSGFVSHTKHTA